MQNFLVSMLVCVILILLLHKVAQRLDMMDCPGGRKLHKHPTPTVGGLAMLIAVMVALLISDGLHGDVAILLGCGVALAALGALDDKHCLAVSLRLMIQVFLVTVVIIGANGIVTHLGDILGFDIPLGMFAIPFSMIAFVGGINSINMIDGADGMAGSMALITTLGATTIFYLAGAVELLPLSWAILGALVGFLFFNSRLFVRRAWVFMGNAGSLWLGLVLCWFMAQVTQGIVSAEPTLVLWLFGIPLLDTLAVMFRRMKHKRSPFHADCAHIHYVLRHLGLSNKHKILLLSLLQMTLIGIGVMFYAEHVPAWIIFWSFVLLEVFYYLLIHNSRTNDRRKKTAELYLGFDDRRQNSGHFMAVDRRKNMAVFNL